MMTITEIGIRGKATFFVATLALLTWSISAMANEPGWTDQERLEKRDMVCLGTVLSTEKVGPVDEHADLYLAVVEITGMKKGKKTSVGSKFNVYYEAATSGQSKMSDSRQVGERGEGNLLSPQYDRSDQSELEDQDGQFWLAHLFVKTQWPGPLHNEHWHLYHQISL